MGKECGTGAGPGMGEARGATGERSEGLIVGGALTGPGAIGWGTIGDGLAVTIRAGACAPSG